MAMWAVLSGLLLLTSQSVWSKPLKVVATTGMIGDLVQNIGGKEVSLETLMGSGVDPHLYKATQGDLRKLLRADVIFYNGLHLEGKMHEVFEKLARKKPVFAVSASIPNQRLLHANGAVDPHIWFDVSLWQMAGKEVLKRLNEQNPSQKAYYSDNAKRYLARLGQLHHWVQAQVHSLPENQRILVTAHDAFGYFGKAYGMEVRGLQGISTASEFGLNDILQLKTLLLQRQVKAVFVESSVPKKFIQSLVAGVKAEGGQLTIGGELYSDAMGLSGTPEGTYPGMVEHNVRAIVGALH